MLQNVETNMLCNSTYFNSNHDGPMFSDDCRIRDRELDETESFLPENCRENNDNNLNITNNNIYRFKFTNEFVEELYQFSIIHQYDHRHDFKEAWEKWNEENEDIINEEVERLLKLGYKGDILDKMFKSVRYYFRKKPYSVTSNETHETHETKTTRSYKALSKLLLETMDQHVRYNLTNEQKQEKPSVAFLEFCRENKDLLTEEISDILKEGIINKEEIINKIKKMYKNRYFFNKVKITKK